MTFLALYLLSAVSLFALAIVTGYEWLRIKAGERIESWPMRDVEAAE